MLTKDQVLAVRPKTKEIEVPEWGGSVNIRPMTEQERGRFSNLAFKYEKAAPADKIVHVTFPIILWCVCDENGDPFFADVKEIEGLAATSPSSAFIRLQEAIFELSMFTKEARAEAEKNSERIRSDGSSLD